MFSAIAMDHAHEQEKNASIKGEDSPFLKNVIEELVNPFKEDGGELLAIDTRDIMLMEVVNSRIHKEKRQQLGLVSLKELSYLVG